MTQVERELRAFVIRALHAAEGNPLPEDTLKASVRTAFPHVAFTAEQLTQLVQTLAAEGFVTLAEDPLFGRLASLTNKGIGLAHRLS